MTPAPSLSPPPEPPVPPLRRFGSWGSYLLLAGVFAALTAWSWRKWADPLVDYGLQLYAPWQLSTGKLLYTDVMYLAGGPLSQYFDALLFRIFGVSLTTLMVANLCILAGFIVLLHRIFRRAAGEWTATMVCLTTLAAFSFGQYTYTGNYNYVCPYSTEAFHGLVLSVMVIAGLWHWISNGSKAWAGAAGFGIGCVLLTKPDLFLAILAALAAAIILAGLTQWKSTDARPGLQLLFLLAGFAVPGLIVVAGYGMKGQPMEGVKAVFAAWLPLLTTSVAHNQYYRWSLGLEDPLGNLIIAVKYTLVFAGILAFLVLGARQLKRNPFIALIFGLLLIGLLYLAYEKFVWTTCGPLIGPVTLLGSVYLGGRWWRRRGTPAGLTLALPFLWSVFALVLLAKMGLAARIAHYGFYLAMPATALVIYLVFHALPQELERFQVDSRTFRLLAAAFIITGLTQLVWITELNYYSTKRLLVGKGADLIYASIRERAPQGFLVESALEWLQANVSPTNTLAVLPEGVIINYLSRHINPTPYTVFALPEVRAYGETNMLAALRQHSPDYILLVHRNPEEYGVKYFGLEPGYGYDIMQWIHNQYTSVWLLGGEPLKTNIHGVMMLRRNDLSSSKP